MIDQAKNVLIDVVALSQKLCSSPIQSKLAYATDENFVGRILDGYSAEAQDVCLLAKQAALALCQVQNYLLQKQLGLYIYDGYRPLRTVKDFAKWFHAPIANENELKRKQIHYPNLEKTDLARLGYAPETVSRHNFGRAVDLVLIHRENLQPLDMGACYDYFDQLSHLTATSKQIGMTAYNNRIILVDAMKKHNFIPYENEFWHFDYHVQEVGEPLDIPILKELKDLNIE